MNFIGDKVIKLQDAKFKLQNNNSNETSIFITGILAQKLNLTNNTKAKFTIDKSDLIKLLCFTFSFKETLYKKDKTTLDLDWFNQQINLINTHYKNSSDFIFDVIKQSQDRFYFKELEQTSGLNIRNLFIQDHTKLSFYQDDINYLIKIECSNISYNEKDIIENSNDISELIHETTSIRDFAFFVFKYFYSKDWHSILNKCVNKPSKINSTDFISYDLDKFKRLFAKFDRPQNKDSLSSAETQRYFDDPFLSENNSYYYFSTQWNGGREYELSFQNLKHYFEEKFNEYEILKIDKTYRLIKKPADTNNALITNEFIKIINNTGLEFSFNLIKRFTASLITKPFVILTGLSGSGKTKLAQTFVKWICESENQYSIVPVGADWTNRDPLLGYTNSLKPQEYVKPDNKALDLILEALENPELPYFLILDEMNLSHVERYFADFLSTMESKEAIPLHANEMSDNKVPGKLDFPPNLFIIGTVNIDETTNMFSPKVLDRANTIEFRVTKDEMTKFLENIKNINMDALTGKGAGMAKSFLEMATKTDFPTTNTEEINITLVQFFETLKKVGAEFGYRSATEMLRLMNQLSVLDHTLTTHQKLDIAIMQKLLPKLHGSRRKLCPVLETLGTLCIQGDVKIITDVFENNTFDYKGAHVLYPLSLEKISRMYRSAIDNGFASFAEA